MRKTTYVCVLLTKKKSPKSQINVAKRNKLSHKPSGAQVTLASIAGCYIITKHIIILESYAIIEIPNEGRRTDCFCEHS